MEVSKLFKRKSHRPEASSPTSRYSRQTYLRKCFWVCAKFSLLRAKASTVRTSRSSVLNEQCATSCNLVLVAFARDSCPISVALIHWLPSLGRLSPARISNRHRLIHTVPKVLYFLPNAIERNVTRLRGEARNPQHKPACKTLRVYELDSYPEQPSIVVSVTGDRAAIFFGLRRMSKPMSNFEG